MVRPGIRWAIWTILASQQAIRIMEIEFIMIFADQKNAQIGQELFMER
jgi:hypothetical protein